MLSALYSDALEAIALRGDAGLPVAALWELLAEPAAAAGLPAAPLAGAARDALWRMLLAAEADVSFLVPPPPGAGPSAPPPKKKGGKRTAAAADDANDGDAGGDAPPADPPARPLTRGAPELASPSAAAAAGAAAAASRALQDASVCLYGAHLTRFQVSDAQRDVLAALGAAGARGRLQNELAARAGADNRNFFYVIKNLEQRGLVVKRPAVAHAPGAAAVQTNLVHLVKFAPSGGGGGAALGRGAGDEGDEDDGEGGGGGAGVTLNDDAEACARACAALAARPERSAREPELKVVLGYAGRDEGRVEGHRAWRRVKGAMLRRGLVEEYLAQPPPAAPGAEAPRAIKCIRLLRPWPGGDECGAGGEGEEGDGAPRLPGGALAPPDAAGAQVCELTLDRQLLRLVAAGGAGGATTADVDAALRLNMKRGAFRVRELQKRFERDARGRRLAVQTVNLGRTILNRYTASGPLLEALGGAFPHDAGGGAFAAVAEAAAAAAAAAAAGAAEGAAEDVAEGDPEAAAGAPAPPAPAPAPAPPAAPPAADDEGGRKRVVTEIGLKRQRWLAAAVAARGFVLVSEVGRLLRDAEAAESGRADVVKPDRKVYARVMDAARAAGELAAVTVSLPGTHGSLAARDARVLVRPGATADAALVERVLARHRAAQRRARAATAAHHASRRGGAAGAAAGAPLPELAPSMLPPRRRGGGGAGARGARAGGAGRPGRPEDDAAALAAQRVAANGFLPGRVQRARVVHELAWRLAAARAGAPLGLEEQLEGEERVFVVAAAPAELGGAAAGAAFSEDVAAAPAAEFVARHGARVVTAAEVWAGMPVGDFCAALGSDLADGARLRALAAAGAPLGALAPADAAAVAGGRAGAARAQGRLTAALDLLKRMGLLGAVVPQGTLSGGWALRGERAAAAYRLREAGVYEEPGPAAGGAPAAAAAVGKGEGEGAGGAGAPGAAPAPPRVQRSFPLADAAGRDAYWDSLHFLVACGPAPAAGEAAAPPRGRGAAPAAASPLAAGFPFASAPEALGERGWALRRDAAGAGAAARAGEALGGEAAAGAGWEACAAAARRLGLPFAAAVAAVREARAAARARARGGAAPGRRLGGLGGAAPGARRARLGGERTAPRAPGRPSAARRRAERAARAAAGEPPSDEYDDDAEAGADSDGGAGDDLRAAPAAAVAPLRKRLWTRAEDRALLSAWASWLAARGPDRVLHWRRLAGRPPAVRAASLRARLRELERSAELGARVLRVKQLAAGVHSRAVLRAAAGAGEKRAGSPGAGAPPAKRPRGAEGGEAGAAAAGGGENLPPGAAPLFDVADEEDAAAAAEVAAEIERVVDAAPKRRREAPGLGGGLPGLSRRAAGGVGAAAGRPPAAPRGRPEALLRAWAAAAAAPPRPLAPPVAAAAQMAKGLLHAAAAAEAAGGAPDDAGAAALTDRFEAAEIRAAFGELFAAGLVAGPGAKQPGALRLSARFGAELRPLFAPGEAVAGAAAAEAALAAAAARGEAAALLPPGAPALGPVAAAAAGAVAAALARVAAGGAALAAAVPPPRAAPPAPGADAGEAPVEDVVALLAGIEVSARLLPTASEEAAEAEAAAAAAAAAASAVPRYSSQEDVLFQPSLVATSAAARTAAAAAARAAAPGGRALLDAALRALRAAGAAGLPAGAAAPPPALLEVLRRHGLARRVAAGDGFAWAVAERSQAALAFPPPPPRGGPAAAAAAAVERALRPLGLPPPGTPQPLADVPARPWTDARGRLSPALWRSLAQRAVSVVARHPGVPEAVLLQGLRLAGGAAGREALGALVAAGALRAERAPARRRRAGGVLGACFGDASEEGEEEAEAGEVLYLPGARTGAWSLAGALPPQVMLPF
jgi:hypothetical protein